MAKVLGLGGVFFRSRDREALAEWYEKWLGMQIAFPYGAVFRSAEQPEGGYSVWSPFESETDYLGSRDQAYMINLVVDDLDGSLAQVKEGGAEVDPDIEESEFGRFGWFSDPEGIRVELWQPPPPKSEPTDGEQS